MNWLSQLMYSPEEKQTVAQTELLRQQMEQQRALQPIQQQIMEHALRQQQYDAQVAQQMAPYKQIQDIANAVASPHQAIQTAAWQQAMQSMYPGGQGMPNPAQQMQIASRSMPGARQGAVKGAETGAQLGATAQFGQLPTDQIAAQNRARLEQIALENAGQLAATRAGRGPTPSNIGDALGSMQGDLQKFNFMLNSVMGDLGQVLKTEDPKQLESRELELKNLLGTVQRSQQIQEVMIAPGVDPIRVKQGYSSIIGDIHLAIQRLKERREQLAKTGMTKQGYIPKGMPEYDMLLP